jgi:hypothetical protein
MRGEKLDASESASEPSATTTTERCASAAAACPVALAYRHAPIRVERRARTLRTVSYLLAVASLTARVGCRPS